MAMVVEGSRDTIVVGSPLKVQKSVSELKSMLFQGCTVLHGAGSALPHSLHAPSPVRTQGVSHQFNLPGKNSIYPP